jgi:pre-mRNA-splicing helicase BRR2
MLIDYHVFFCKRFEFLCDCFVIVIHFLARSDLLITIPEHWDCLSRRWNKRKAIQNIKLYIFDEIHLIGYDEGPTLEVVVSRVRYIAQQLLLQWQADQKSSGQVPDKKNAPFTRIVALSTSLANAKDIGEWIGATPQSLFNFHPNVRPVPLEIQIQGVCTCLYFLSLLIRLILSKLIKRERISN